MMLNELDQARINFAEKLRQEAKLRSPALAHAFGIVPRENFVGPGPWKILAPPDVMEYRDTPDADPRHLYANILIALDSSRNLNNGEPLALAKWLDILELAPGESFLHIGCGVGYYTAIAATIVSPGGDILGVEIDPALAERARHNLAPYANVRVICGDGSGFAADLFDAILVNAGATQIHADWIKYLRPKGRLLVPMTIDIPGMDAGVGHMLLIKRYPQGYSARFVSPVGIFHCAGARDQESEKLLKQAYAQGGEDTVCSLKREAHPPTVQCWLHGPIFCLSRLSVDESGSTQ